MPTALPTDLATSLTTEKKEEGQIDNLFAFLGDFNPTKRSAAFKGADVLAQMADELTADIDSMFDDRPRIVRPTAAPVLPGSKSSMAIRSLTQSRSSLAIKSLAQDTPTPSAEPANADSAPTHSSSESTSEKRKQSIEEGPAQEKTEVSLTIPPDIKVTLMITPTLSLEVDQFHAEVLGKHR